MISRKAKAFFKESDLDAAEAWLEMHKEINPTSRMKMFKLRKIYNHRGLSDGPGWAIATGPAMLYRCNGRHGVADLAPNMDD